jgi:hypothetical protein
MRFILAIAIVTACGMALLLPPAVMAANPCSGGKYDSKDCYKMKANANKRQHQPNTGPKYIVPRQKKN